MMFCATGGGEQVVLFKTSLCSFPLEFAYSKWFATANKYSIVLWRVEPDMKIRTIVGEKCLGTIYLLSNNKNAYFVARTKSSTLRVIAKHDNSHFSRRTNCIFYGKTKLSYYNKQFIRSARMVNYNP